MDCSNDDAPERDEDHPGSAQAARYDAIADGYARWWGPVIAPAAIALLDRVAPFVVPGARIVDIGTGTGTLALAAVDRWPQATVAGVDASAGMAARAEREADERLAREDRHRLEIAVAFADRLPFGDETFDVAVSSFVFQLVPSRLRALREARRVLSPGGWLGYVTWLSGERSYRPDEILDQVLAEFGFDPREPDPRPGDLPSLEAATKQMRRAGFEQVRAESATLVHRWTAEGYVGFVEEFDERSTFEELGRQRGAARRRLLRRLERLSDEELTLELPIAYVLGRRPDR